MVSTRLVVRRLRPARVDDVPARLECCCTCGVFVVAVWSVVAVISLAVVVLAALGVVSCLVSPQRPVPRGMGGEPPHSTLPVSIHHTRPAPLPERLAARGAGPLCLSTLAMHANSR